MNALSPDVRRIRDLLDENDTLREEVRQLRELLAPQLDVPASWRLSRSEAKILRAIRAGGPCWVSGERIYVALYGSGDDGPAYNTFSAIMSHLRTKLRLHAPSITIEHLRDFGWRLSPGGVAALDAACAAERAAYAATPQESREDDQAN